MCSANVWPGFTANFWWPMSEPTAVRPRLLVVQSSINDAQQLRHVGALRRAGFDVTNVGFNRASSTPQILGGHSLGSISNSSYWVRWWPFMRAVPELRRHARRADVVLAFGPDLSALVGSITPRRVPVVLAFSDLMDVMAHRGPQGILTRVILRWALRRCRLLIVSSEHFVTDYLSTLVRRLPEWVRVRNLPDQGIGLPEPSAVPALPGRLRIGYFGLLRCAWTLNVLATLVTDHPERFEVVLAGIHMDGVPVPEVEGFIDTGPYRNPEDLESLYSRIDVAWSAYPFSGSAMNMRAARTNRFYEALAFMKPQIGNGASAEGTELAEMKLGITLNGGDVGTAVRAIVSVSDAKWAEYARASTDVAPSVGSFDGEIAVLVGRLAQMLGFSATTPPYSGEQAQ
jgi:succinoglycan biosynthesis protein ExoL